MSEIKANQKKDNIFILIISLVIISAVAAGVLAVVDYVTQKPREEATLRVTVAAFKQLQPDFNNDPVNEVGYIVSTDGKKWSVLKKGESADAYGLNVVTVYPAKEDGKLVSLFAQAVSPIGYGGNLTVLLAMKPDGSIINVVVTDQTETPGLGTAVFAREIKKTIWGLLSGEYKDEGDKLAPNPLMDFFNKKEYVPDDRYTSADKSSSDIIPASKWKVIKDGGDFKFITGATITSRAVTDGVKIIVSAYYDTEKEVLKMYGAEKKQK
jgi:Na+-translocating ferredoxin:NAD+ oxidoreductase subunit G